MVTPDAAGRSAAAHQGVVAFVEESARRVAGRGAGSATEPPLLLVLDGVQDPHNLGACLRVADRWGACGDRTPRTGRLPQRHRATKSLRARGKACPLSSLPNLARALRDLKDKEYGYSAAAEAGATTLSKPAFGALALVLGGGRRAATAYARDLRRIDRDPMLAR